MITISPTLDVAEFTVEKDLLENHSTTCALSVNAFDTGVPIRQMRGPIYKQQVDQKTAQKIAGAPPAYTEADAPTATK